MPGITSPNSSDGLFPALRALSRADSEQRLAQIRLATARRLNRGADDPAGLIAAENLDARLTELEAQARSAERADAIARTADAALAEVSSLAQEAASLAVASANTAALSTEELDANQAQIDSIAQSIGRALSGASFNGTPLFNGDLSLGVAGAILDLPALTPASLGLTEVNAQPLALADTVSGQPGSLVFSPAAASAIFSSVIGTVATLRGSIGAFQSVALAPLAASLAVEAVNTQDALSSIRDADFAREASAMARSDALAAASLAALTTASTAPARALDLLG